MSDGLKEPGAIPGRVKRVGLSFQARNAYRREKKLLAKRDAQLVYVFAPGKTATSTYVRTLRNEAKRRTAEPNSARKLRVYDGRVWLQAGLPAMIERYIGGGYSTPHKLIKNARNQALHDMITTNQLSVDVIVGVRDPIDMYVSGVFQQLTRNPATSSVRDPAELSTLISRNIASINPDLLYGDLSEEPALEANFVYPLVWMDYCFTGLFGTPAYDFPFDIDSGYGTGEANQCRIFFIAVESDEQLKVEVLQDIAANPDLKLEHKNIGANKAYADLYHQVKDMVFIEPETIQALAQTHYVRHFYGEDHGARMVNKWTRG